MTPKHTKYTPKIYNVLFFIILCNAVAFSQSTIIPDPSFEQALIDYNIDTNGLNGNILNSDAEAIETLNIFNKNITNLTGIEAFVNLKYLYCYFNNVEILNLENNLQLEVLDIENNSIQNIDISNNVHLKEIYLSNNLLEELDVSNNLDLEVLACSLNNISELNVSNNLNLEVLWSYSNELSELILANNLLLESLFCGDNNLEGLDISQNSLLQSISFADNNLYEFNFSHCLDLKYLDVSGNNLNTLDISSNLYLERLLCSNNSITDIDLSSLDDLFLFYASNNQLTELDLSTNSELRYLGIHSNDLNVLDIRNGQNEFMNEFNAFDNSSLTCIYVDTATPQYLGSWNIDVVTSFVENQDQCNALSIKEEEETITFKMFPNPTTDYLNINILNPHSSLNIYNIHGQIVLTQKLTQGTNHINLNQTSSGMYLVEITSENRTLIKKLVVK